MPPPSLVEREEEEEEEEEWVPLFLAEVSSGAAVGRG